MEEEPNFLDKMIYAGFSPRTSHIHHPFMGRLIIFFSLVRGNVPGKEIDKHKTKTPNR